MVVSLLSYQCSRVPYCSFFKAKQKPMAFTDLSTQLQLTCHMLTIRNVISFWGGRESGKGSECSRNMHERRDPDNQSWGSHK